MELSDQSNLLDIANDVISRARAKGADDADAMIAYTLSQAAQVRMGELEDVERSESQDLGLRVFIGKSQASVSTTDFSSASMDETVERAIAMAKAAPDDEFAGLADAREISAAFADLDLFDSSAPDAAALKERALEAEAAALAVKGVTNSSGANAAHGVAGICLAATNGFAGAYRRSSHSVSCSVIAGEGTAMETDYDFSSTVHLADLDSAAKIGRNAGERAVRALNSQKLGSASVPVFFDARVATNLISNFASAINGAAVARGTTFLKDAMGTQVFERQISVIDDPLMVRGLRSRPFDGEGVTPQPIRLIDKGDLTSWLLDCRSARQLKLKPNGRASRGVGGAPTPGATNLYLDAGPKSPRELMADVREGLLVTRLMGAGGSTVTGDYSNGIAGFWIKDGEIAFPVSEMTIAGDLRSMFMNMEPASDLEFKRGINAPTVRVEGMTVAGK